jgi:hypothetical protein
MNPNYTTVAKQDLDKLLVARFITLVEEATGLSPICGGTKKEQEASNLHGFPKIEHCH